MSNIRFLLNRRKKQDPHGKVSVYTGYNFSQSTDSSSTPHQQQAGQQQPVAVMVHSVDRSQQPQLLRPQEVRTVEVPWYEDQVGSCAFSVPVACLGGLERGREGEFGHQCKACGERTKRYLFRFCSYV